jgi:hypothetical protein
MQAANFLRTVEHVELPSPVVWESQGLSCIVTAVGLGRVKTLRREHSRRWDFGCQLIWSCPRVWRLFALEVV